jgi:hypothetical protein
LFTTSAEMWCDRHSATKVFLKPASQKIFFKRPDRTLARWRASMPPVLSETLAARTTTATSGSTRLSGETSTGSLAASVVTAR